MYLISILYILVLKVDNLRPLFYYYIFKGFFFDVFMYLVFFRTLIFYNNLYSIIINGIKIY